jgi:peptide/nickel transport system ATP-binding protein
MPPRSGQMLFNGTELPASYKNRTKDQLRKIQLVYQSPDTALNPKQSVGDIVGWPVQHFRGLTGKQRDQRVKDILASIELDPSKFLDRLPHELSGGQKQRVGMARALAAEPEVIICDEVTSALDQLVAEGILRLLEKVQQEFGISFMFITHDLATVEAIADEVVVMSKGKIVEQGPKSSVLNAPREDYTKLLISSVPKMDENWLTQAIENSRVAS